MEPAPSQIAPESDAAADLQMVLRGLLAALGMWGLKPVLALLVYRRIGPIATRIERMLHRLRAGRLWRVLDRAAPRLPTVRRPCPVAPRRFGWLVQAGGYQAAGFGSQLQAVLETPEMAALLAASPQAGRILRPLCRALAIDLPGPPPQPNAARAMRNPRRRRSAAPIPEWAPFRIGLPRGVLAAARREGFGKDR